MLFRAHPEFRNSAAKLCRGIDTRGDGGNIVWWPATGLGILHRFVLADIPEWIIESLNPPKPARMQGSHSTTLMHGMASRRPARGYGGMWGASHAIEDVPFQHRGVLHILGRCCTCRALKGVWIIAMNWLVAHPVAQLLHLKA